MKRQYAIGIILLGVIILILSIGCFLFIKENKPERQTINPSISYNSNSIAYGVQGISELQDSMPTNSDDIPVWQDSLDDSTINLLWDIIKNITPSQLENFGNYSDDGLEPNTFQRFIEHIAIDEDNVVSSLNRYNGNPEIMRWMLKISPAFCRSVLAYDDKKYLELKLIYDSFFTTEDSRKQLIGKVLLANAVFEKRPDLLTVCKYVSLKEIQSDRVQFTSFISMLFGDQVAEHFKENNEVISFWIERELDGTSEIVKQILTRFINVNFNGKAMLDSINIVASSYVKEENPIDTIVKSFPIFFDTNTFIDPSYPPSVSKLDIRKNVLCANICASIKALSSLGNNSTQIEGKELLDLLNNAGSKYFSKDVYYYTFVYSKDNKSYSWEPINLDPTMIICGYGWDDGVYDIGIILRVMKPDIKKIPVMFAGFQSVPDNFLKRSLAFSNAAVFHSRAVFSRDTGRYCREVIKKWDVPTGVTNVSQLIAIDKYRYIRGDLMYNAPGEVEVSNQDNMGITFLPAQAGSVDTNTYDLVQEKSLFYAILDNKDTVLLCEDSTSGGYGDGTLCLRAARCYEPIFLDANGDSICDILVSTSKEHVLLLKNVNGSYTKVQL